jgi:hypothetical protein
MISRIFAIGLKSLGVASRHQSPISSLIAIQGQEAECSTICLSLPSTYRGSERSLYDYVEHE